MLLLEEGDINEEWQPVFDPEAYLKENQPLSLERFKLSATELKDWAERLTRLRVGIERRAKLMAHVEPEAAIEDGAPRSRRGHKRSKASHNNEGLQEKELKELRLIERAPCR